MLQAFTGGSYARVCEANQVPLNKICKPVCSTTALTDMDFYTLFTGIAGASLVNLKLSSREDLSEMLEPAYIALHPCKQMVCWVDSISCQD